MNGRAARSRRGPADKALNQLGHQRGQGAFQDLNKPKDTLQCLDVEKHVYSEINIGLNVGRGGSHAIAANAEDA